MNEITFISKKKIYCDCKCNEPMEEYTAKDKNGNEWPEKVCKGCKRKYKVINL